MLASLTIWSAFLASKDPFSGPLEDAMTELVGLGGVKKQINDLCNSLKVLG
jgi:hypothetical protein